MKPEPRRDDNNVPWCDTWENSGKCRDVDGAGCLMTRVRLKDLTSKACLCYPQVQLDEAELARLQDIVGKTERVIQGWMDRVEERNQQIDLDTEQINQLQAVVEKLHPRVLKLAAREDEPFIVIGPREPYFAQAYNLIKAHEEKNGDWGHGCEVAFRKAQKIHDHLMDLWLAAFGELRCSGCKSGVIPIGEMRCCFCMAKRPIESIRESQDSFREAAEAARNPE